MPIPEMVILSPNANNTNSDGSNLIKPIPPTMLRQGGFFGKSRHAPVSTVDLKRNAGAADTPINHKPPGVGPQSATGGNLTPLGPPIHVQRPALNSNETQPAPQTPQISHETPPPVMKGTMTAPTAVDPNRSGSYETAEKDREGTRPRKSVMRKVSAQMIRVQCDPIRFGLISNYSISNYCTLNK